MRRATARRLRRLELPIRSRRHEVGFVVGATGRVLLFATSSDPGVIVHDEAALERLGAEGLLEDAVYTHNHPNDFAFSWSDVQFLLRWRMEEFRAVGPRSRYRMRLGREVPWPDIQAAQEAWNAAEVAAYEWLAARIEDGTLSWSRADAVYWHIVCRMALPGVGLRYRKESWTA